MGAKPGSPSRGNRVRAYDKCHTVSLGDEFYPGPLSPKRFNPGGVLCDICHLTAGELDNGRMALAPDVKRCDKCHTVMCAPIQCDKCHLTSGRPLCGPSLCQVASLD